MILYLDYDGVLHHRFVQLVGGQPTIEIDGFSLFQWAPILENLLAPHPEVQIVLTTSWREWNEGEAIRRLPDGLRQRVIGVTRKYIGWGRRQPRFQEILDDAKERGLALDEWFAIDDDTFCWPAPIRHRIVITNGTRGVSDPEVQEQIRQMLSSP